MAPLIDNGVYVDGRRVATPTTLDETYRTLHAVGGMAWIGLYRPDPAEVASVAAEFGLHPLAVEDVELPELDRLLGIPVPGGAERDEEGLAVPFHLRALVPGEGVLHGTGGGVRAGHVR